MRALRLELEGWQEALSTRAVWVWLLVNVTLFAAATTAGVLWAEHGWVTVAAVAAVVLVGLLTMLRRGSATF